MAGAGKPLLLVHGFGASIGHWRKNIPILADGGYRVFAIDLLGFGGSAKPPLDYSMDLWQEMLRDFWEANIGEPTVFVGNSIGALLSLMMVADYPDIAAGAILINSAGGMNHLATNKPASLPKSGIRTGSQPSRPCHSIHGAARARVTGRAVDPLFAPSRLPGKGGISASSDTPSRR